MNNSWANEVPQNPTIQRVAKLPSICFVFLKHSWSLARPFQIPYLQFLRGGEAPKLLVTWRPSLFTVSGSQLLFQAPT
jgi:hypothetical protein